MPDSSKLSYKFQRLRETIRRAIVTGELTNKLPGERELARMFGANAKTISKALTDLTSEGILIRQVGRGTFVAESASDGTRPAPRQDQRIACLASGAVERSVVEQLFDMAASRLLLRGHQAIRTVVTPQASGHLAERCVPISQLRELSGILILCCVPSDALLADLARRHIPVVLCSSASQVVKANAVVPDYARGGFELTEHLIQLGHEQVQPVVGETASRSAAEFMRGYSTAMQRHGLQPASMVNSTVEQGLSWTSKPSAVVCLGAQQARVLKLRLDSQLSHGRVSVAAMALPHEINTSMGLTAYEVDTGIILDSAVRMVVEAAPGDAPREVIVPGQFKDRGTCYASNGRVAAPPQTVVL